MVVVNHKVICEAEGATISSIMKKMQAVMEAINFRRSSDLRSLGSQQTKGSKCSAFSKMDSATVAGSGSHSAVGVSSRWQFRDPFTATHTKGPK